MSDEFLDNFMFIAMMKELPRNEFLFRLREDFRYIIKTIEHDSPDQPRLERLKRWKIMIKELYLAMTGFEIEDDIGKG